MMARKRRTVRFALTFLVPAVLLPLAATSAEAAVWYRTNPNGCDLQVNPDTDPGWHSLGGCLKGNPAGAQGADSNVFIFGRGTDNGVWYVQSSGPAGSLPYSGWHNLGGKITSDPEAWADNGGRVGVKGTGTDGNKWCTWNYSPNSNSWVSWRRC